MDELELIKTLCPFWLHRVVQTMTKRNLELTIIPFKGSDELTFGDPEKLLQVFRNLLSNAVKFTPDGGKVLFDGR